LFKIYTYKVLDMLQIERSAGAVIFTLNGEPEYLILQYGSGHWDFPRGNIEKNEKEIEAAKREIFEETGIEELEFIFGFKEKVKFFYRKKGRNIRKEVIYFLARSNTKDVKLSFEHKNFKWLPLERALETLTFETSREVLRKAHRYLANLGIIKEREDKKGDINKS